MFMDVGGCVSYKYVSWNGSGCCSKYLCVRVLAVQILLTYIYACVKVRRGNNSTQQRSLCLPASWNFVHVSSNKHLRPLKVEEAKN